MKLIADNIRITKQSIQQALIKKDPLPIQTLAKLEKILPLAKKYKTDLIGFLLYPDSRVPKNSSERFEIALELLARVELSGVAKEQLIIDPVVPPLSWDDGLFRAATLLTLDVP